MRKSFVLLAAIATVAAHADTLTLSGLALGTNTGTLQLAGTLNGAYYAGPFGAKLNDGASMRVFCIDLGHEAHYNVADAVILQDTATMGAGYAHAAQIFNKYGAAAGDDAKLNAAVQGAIWKSITGNALTLADGTTGASALALSYVGEDLSAYSTHATFYNVGGASQSMIGHAAPVPEPASMAALAIGGMGLLRRRKRA